MNRHPGLLDPERTGLLVIDVQEKFRPAMAAFDDMVAGCSKLVRTFQLLELPIFVTEQYPKGLGRTVSELQGDLASEDIREKTRFSSLGCSGLPEQLRASNLAAVLCCGIESHVCVQQTVHDLLQAGYSVHVARDAVESRRPADRDAAFERMARAGAVLTTSEMAAFELLVDACHPRFKEVQALFK